MAAIAIFHEVKPLRVLIFHLYEIPFHSKLYTQHFVRSPGSSLGINLIQPLVQRATVRLKYPTQEHNTVTQPRLAPRTFNLSTHPAGPYFLPSKRKIIREYKFNINSNYNLG